MKKLRLAVIGAGRLGGFHAQKLSGMDRVELVGVADPDSTARNRVATECNTRPVADYRELPHSSNGAAIDAAVIAAPTRLHHRLALEMLDRGIHLLVEKPLCGTRAEADELVEAAAKRSVVLQVGHVERFNPAVAAALPHTNEPRYIEAVRASGFTFRSTDIGAVLDLMIHDIDLVLSMVRSPVRRVQAMGLSVLGGHEDVANARLEFQSGCVAVLNASRVSHNAVRTMKVWSARAFADIDFATREVALIEPSETLLRRQLDVDSLTPDEVEHYKEHLFDEHLPCQRRQFEAVDALTLELDDFLGSIRDARPPRVSGEQGRDAVAVAEQVLAKINTHAWDDTADGPVGPLAIPRPSVIPAPHWDLTPSVLPIERKEAG